MSHVDIHQISPINILLEEFLSLYTSMYTQTYNFHCFKSAMNGVTPWNRTKYLYWMTK